MKKTPQPYNPHWKTAFDNIKKVLQNKLEDIQSETDIQHIGSTSVEGLYAKPILDIDIIISDKSLIHGISSRLEEIGYSSRGELGIPGRFAFKQVSELTPLTPENTKWQSHHLYVCYADSLALKNHLAFRDALNGNQKLLEEYAALKKSIISHSEITMEEYCMKKTDFIISVLASAGLSPEELEEIRSSNT